MTKKIKILVESDGLVETLGMNAPIMTPTLVNLKTMMYIVNEGHKVKVVTPSGVNVDVNEKYIKKMIRRGDTGAEEVWKSIQKKSKTKAPNIEINTDNKESSVTTTKNKNKDNKNTNKKNTNNVKVDDDKEKDNKDDKKSYTSSKKKSYKTSSSKKKN